MCGVAPEFLVQLSMRDTAMRAGNESSIEGLATCT